MLDRMTPAHRQPVSAVTGDSQTEHEIPSHLTVEMRERIAGWTTHIEKSVELVISSDGFPVIRRVFTRVWLARNYVADALEKEHAAATLGSNQTDA